MEKYLADLLNSTFNDEIKKAYIDGTEAGIIKGVDMFMDILEQLITEKNMPGIDLEGLKMVAKAIKDNRTAK